MKTHKSDLAIFVILVFLAFVTLYVYVVTQNITIYYFNWNPPPKLNIIPFGLSYPDTPGITIPGTDLYVSFVVAFNGSIAENTPIQIANATGQTVSEDYLANLWSVDIGFQQAIPWQFKNLFQQGGTYISGLSGVDFSRNVMNANDSKLYPSEDMIYFPVAGDFSPAIRVQFYNGTENLYTYNEIKVHVLSTSEIESTNASKINLTLTYALLGFSYIEGITVIRDLWERRNEKNQLEVNSTNSQPKTKEHTPIKSKPKKISPSSD